ncbi:MAG: hypothetical protein H6Q89_2553, partial [Myxococcaceae bacterium]|nr:hypothetical protein [Myxococcaceae bacterium]
AMAMLPRVARSGTADFSGKLRRAGLLLLWGYALTLPWWAEGFPFTETTAVWMPFWTAGVLQTLGVALLIATVLLWLVRTPQVFLALCAGAAVLSVVGASWALAHAAAWPTVVRGFFDPQGAGGGFPLAPWGGYFFAGVTLGGALWLRRAKPLASGAALGVIAGVAFLAQKLLLGSDALLVWRFAWVAALLAVATILTARLARLPSALRLLGQHALTFYVAHMVLLWGAPKFPGLVHRFPPELGWLACLALTAGCLAVTALGLVLIARTRALFGPPSARRAEE